jgi:hypothetical protein
MYRGSVRMLFGFIFLSCGILLIVSAAVNIYRNIWLKRNGILVSATVVDIYRRRRGGKHKSRIQYHPVFEYLVDEELVKARGPGAAEVGYPVGTVMEIRYHPKRPKRILTGKPVTSADIAPIWIGIVFIIGSLLSMLGVKLPEFTAPGYLAPVVILLVFIILIVIIVKLLRGFRKRYTQHALTERTADNVLVAAKNENRTISFQFVNGNTIDYIVPEAVYNELQAGDWGKLTFQGSLFISFEKTYR